MGNGGGEGVGVGGEGGGTDPQVIMSEFGVCTTVTGAGSVNWYVPAGPDHGDGRVIGPELGNVDVA